MLQLLFRRKRALVIAAGLSALSLLVVWDVHTLRQQSNFGYHDGVMEVREYSGELGVFRVLYSKLRDANEANALLAAKSRLSYSVADSDIDIDIIDNETQPVEEKLERVVEEPENSEETATVVVSMKFRPLARSHRDEYEAGGTYEEYAADNEEQKSPQERTNLQDTNFRPLQRDTVSSPTVTTEPTHRAQAIPKQRHVFSNHSNPFSNAKRQKTTLDAIKKLLLYNEIESAEALWNLTKSQQLSSHSENEKPSNTPQQQITQSTHNKHKMSDQFRVQRSMSWPVPQFTKTDILKEKWVEDLKQYLQGITEWRQISVVTANQEHQEVVLNWLSSAVTVAKMSLRNILVLSLSPTLHSLLVSKKMNSIYVSPSSVINHAGLKRITSAFNQVGKTVINMHVRVRIGSCRIIIISADPHCSSDILSPDESLGLRCGDV